MEKQCNQCGKIKPFEMFSPDKRALTGCQGRCRECLADNAKARYAANPEILAATQRSRKANPDRWNAYRRAAYARDPEGERAKSKDDRLKNPERVKAAKRKNRLAHPEKHARHEHKRRAAKRGNGGTYSLRDRNRLFNRYSELCAYCQKRKANTLEHVIPLSRGGTNFIGNLLPCCGPCNFSKGAKLLVEWRNKGK